MFQVTRNECRVNIGGVVWVEHYPMTKGEWMSPWQVGIFNILIEHGWNLFHPCSKGRIDLDPFTAHCNSESIAMETEMILKERIDQWSIHYSEPE